MYEGRWTTFGIGSASPSATSNGHGYAAVVDGYGWFLDEFGMPYLSYSTSWIGFSGFTSDPGASWLVSVGGRSMAGQAYTYQSAYGNAVWGMPTGVAFGMSYGTPYALTVVHN